MSTQEQGKWGITALMNAAAFGEVAVDKQTVDSNPHGKD
jgi:hypothetical protein